MHEVSEAGRVAVRHDSDRRRYELLLNGRVAGFADYHAQPGLVTVMHTEVDPAFEGRGLGSTLMARILDDIRARHAQVLPVCPFMRAYLGRHAEHTDLVWKP